MIASSDENEHKRVIEPEEIQRTSPMRRKLLQFPGDSRESHDVTEYVGGDRDDDGTWRCPLVEPRRFRTGVGPHLFEEIESYTAIRRS